MKKSKKIKILTIPILALALVLNLTLPVAAEVTEVTAPVQTEGSLIDDQQVKPDDTKEEDLKEDPEEEKKKEESEYSEKEKKEDPAEEQEGEKNEDDSEEAESDPKDNEDPDEDDEKKEFQDEDVIPADGNLKVEKSEIPVLKTKAFKNVSGAAASVVEDNAAEKKAVSIKIVSADLVEGENKIAVTAEFYDADGGVPENISGNYKVWFYTTGKANKNTITSETNSITKYIQTSNSNEYDVYFELRSKDEELIAASEHIPVRTVKTSLDKDFTITASADEEDTGVIEYTGTGEISRLSYYPEGNTSAVNTVEGKTITGLKPGTYYVFSPAYSDGYTYYFKSSAAKLTVSGGGVAPVKEFKVKTSGDENVKFSKSLQTVKDGLDAGVFINPVDSKTHYIDADSIRVEPKSNYGSLSYYASTGELTVTGVTGDITIYASSKEKVTVSSLSVKSVSFNENGIYSESSPGIQTQIEVEAKDKNGDPVPDVTLYLKKDKNDVSSAQNRKTDANGIASFKLSYEINRENGSTSEDHTALIGTDSGFSGVSVTTDIHLVLQLKSDLVLYTDQIIGTKPEQNDGKIINVSEGYEIWTGDVHDGYLVVGSGKWEKIVNGEASGLSSGWHALRAGAKIDGNTYYFASDYDFFEVPRGVWDITIDKTGSGNVIFTGNESLTAEPGGTVYVYLKPADGFKIDSFSVNKPSYVSGRIYYSEDNGYIVIEGISGSLVLTVNAVKNSVNTPASNVTEDDKTVVNENDPSSQGDTNENSNDDGSNEDTPVISFIAPAQIPYVLNSDIVIPAGTVLSARVPKRTTVSTVQKKTFHEVADEIISNGDKAPKPEKAKDPVEKEIKEPAETKTIEGEAVALSGSLDVETDLKEANRIWILLLILLLVAIITGAYVIQKQKGNKNDPVGK